MTTAAFAALETRLNAAAIAHTANAVATGVDAYGQPVEFDVIFDDGFAADGLMSDTAPRVQCLSANVASVDWGSGLEIRGTRYTVTSPQPDGTGWSTLTLRRL